MKAFMNGIVAGVVCLIVSMPAIAGPIASPMQWTAGSEDATLAGKKADGFKFFSGGNTHAGNFDLSTLPAANQSNAWSVFGKSESGMSFISQNLSVKFSTDAQSMVTGKWTIANTSTLDASLDLILSIKASNASGAFFFDNQSILAGQELSGTWAIEWLAKEGKQNSPDFSNFAFFQRELVFVEAAEAPANGDVPEPGSVALLGLGALGMLALRKRRGAR